MSGWSPATSVGPARENLTATLALPLSRKPDIAFGVVGAGLYEVVEGDGSILVGT